MGSPQSKQQNIEKKPSIETIENGGIVTESEGSEVPTVISDKENIPKNHAALQIDTKTTESAEILTAMEARNTTGSDVDEGLETLGRSVETLFDIESVESDDSTQMVSDVMPEFEASSESDSDENYIASYSSSDESKITTYSALSSESESQKLLEQAEMNKIKEEIKAFSDGRQSNQIMDDPFSRSVLAHLNLAQMDKKTRRDTILKLPKPREMFLMHLMEQGEDTTLFSENPWKVTGYWMDDEVDQLDPELDPKSYGDMKGENPLWREGSDNSENAAWAEMPPIPSIQDYFRHGNIRRSTERSEMEMFQLIPVRSGFQNTRFSRVGKWTMELSNWSLWLVFRKIISPPATS